MNEIDILDIELLQILVNDEIQRIINSSIENGGYHETKLFDLRLLKHKLEVMRRSRL